MISSSQGQRLLSVLQHYGNTNRWGVVAVIGITLLGVFLSASAQAAVFTVNSPFDVSDASPGNRVCETAPGNGVCTLRAAVQESNALTGADTIILPPNTYLLTQLAELTITGDLTITGSGASTTIIDGNKDLRANRGVLTIDFATVNISGLTIRNGERAQGGGIYKTGTLTLINSAVSGNVASQGGGIYNGSGTLTLTNSTVSGNSAADGGGIFNPFFGLTIVTNSTVMGNAASNRGGGISNDTGTLTLTNSTVSGNSANSGGGIYNNLRDTKVFSSTIANNQAGGGVLSVGFGATVAFQNTILAGNLPYDCSGIAFVSGGNNLMGTQSCTLSGGGVTVADPMLGPLRDNGGPTKTHALLPGSLAIDAGNPNGCRDNLGALLTTDQRGFPRPGDGNQDGVLACDIGAYELFTTSTTSVVAAVLPSSRSVRVGVAATAFATVINAGQAIAVGCGLAPASGLPASFIYQTTDAPTNQVTGFPNTAANIPAGVAQSFVFAITPTAPIASTDVQFSFVCSNTDPAPINVGLNTLLLSASNTPVPDVVALAATLSNDGIVNIPGTNGAGAFAVATVNLGATGTITASADTGSATLPVNISLCQTNPASGQCISAIGPSVTTTINANATPTFGIFVQGNGNMPFDPAANRVFVRFIDGGGVTRGSTSVAVRTQ